MAGVLVQIRDVDPEVRDRLKARAAAEGISLNSLLKRVLEDSARWPTPQEVVSRLRARGPGLPTDGSAPTGAEVTRAIREEREAELAARETMRRVRH